MFALYRRWFQTCHLPFGYLVGNEWAMSGQYLSMHLELKIKITLKCRPKGHLKYDILVSLKCKLKHLF
jgi:hypothetical protein